MDRQTVLYTEWTPHTRGVLIAHLETTLVLLRQHRYPLTDPSSIPLARIISETRNLLMTLDPSSPEVF